MRCLYYLYLVNNYTVEDALKLEDLRRRHIRLFGGIIT